jgi:hypothetical protein
MSKFLSNPGEKHYDAAMFAMGFLSAKRDEYLAYKRSVNFDGIFRLFTMVDADLGGDHTSGNNGNSVMAAVTFLNEPHCYSYSKSIKAVCLATYQSEYYYALTEGNQMAICG